MDDSPDDRDEENGLVITGCDPSHEFLEIPRHIWGPSGPIKGQVFIDQIAAILAKVGAVLANPVIGE